VIYTPFARLLHHEGGTRGFSLPAGDVLRATFSMLRQATTQDPYYNPNLSHLERIPTLARRGEEPREFRLLSILESFDLVAAPAYRFKDGALFPNVVGSKQRMVCIRQIETGNALPRRAILITHELSRTGAPILLLEMAKFLDKMGWQVTVLSPTEGTLHESCDQANIKVELVASLLSDARLLLPYLAEADLVMANTILTYRMIHAAQACGVPSIWWIYESRFGSEFVRDHPGAAQALQAAEAVIFASENTRSLYQDFLRKDNVHTIYTGIDVRPASRDDCSHPVELDRNFYNVVLVASIEHRKGQDIFLKAYTGLPADIRAKMRCYLIGRHLDTLSADRKFYQQILKEARSLPNIHLLGELPEPDVHYILSQADLFVLPSRDEVLPVTILEAMAFAKPVLTTRVGGIAEIIENNINGVLIDSADKERPADQVRSDDPTALRDQMVRLFQEPELGRRLGQAARQTYEARLTYAIFTEQVMKLVEGLCSKEDNPGGTYL
jgi:glycosyltransferase involved in cell wall biosynthesis